MKLPSCTERTRTAPGLNVSERLTVATRLTFEIEDAKGRRSTVEASAEVRPLGQ
jgi:hypothetical protein